MTGRIKTTGDLEIEGEVDGVVDALRLKVGPRGRLRTTIEADDAVVSGNVAGIIKARGVTFTDGCHFTGEVQYEQLGMEPDASVEGRLVPVVDGNARTDVGQIVQTARVAKRPVPHIPRHVAAVQPAPPRRHPWLTGLFVIVVLIASAVIGALYISPAARDWRTAMVEAVRDRKPADAPAASVGPAAVAAPAASGDEPAPVADAEPAVTSPADTVPPSKPAPPPEPAVDDPVPPAPSPVAAEPKAEPVAPAPARPEPAPVVQEPTPAPPAPPAKEPAAKAPDVKVPESPAGPDPAAVVAPAIPASAPPPVKVAPVQPPAAETPPPAPPKAVAQPPSGGKVPQPAKSAPAPVSDAKPPTGTKPPPAAPPPSHTPTPTPTPTATPTATPTPPSTGAGGTATPGARGAKPEDEGCVWVKQCAPDDPERCASVRRCGD